MNDELQPAGGADPGDQLRKQAIDSLHRKDAFKKTGRPLCGGQHPAGRDLGLHLG